MSEKIREYYKLCSIRNGGKAHHMNTFSGEELNMFYSKKEQDKYFVIRNFEITANEQVIGGNEEENNNNNKITIY
jgi:hypothetical protein